MARHSPHPRQQSAVNMDTGEVVQFTLFEPEEPQQRSDTRKRPRYDWTPNPGRHVNVGKTLMAKVWRKDSGYTQNDRDIFGFYVAHTPDGAEPLRLTFKEISTILGVRQETVGKSVAKLHVGGLLLAAETIGRMKFYRVNPRAAFDGTADAQLEATKHARHPVVPAPKTPARTRKKEAS